MSDLQFIGAHLNSEQLEATIKHLFETNLRNETTGGKRPAPICIWGTHGIGKTHVIQAYAKTHGWKLAYCASIDVAKAPSLAGTHCWFYRFHAN